MVALFKPPRRPMGDLKTVSNNYAFLAQLAHYWLLFARVGSILELFVQLLGYIEFYVYVSAYIVHTVRVK